MMLKFEWDEAKSASNVAKHGLPFGEAVAVFADVNRADLDASHAEDDEERRKTIGRMGGRLFTVVYTLRGAAIRLISARPANSKEVRQYGHRSIRS